MGRSIRCFSCLVPSVLNASQGPAKVTGSGSGHTHLEKVLSALVHADSSPLASGIVETVLIECLREVKILPEASQ